MSAGIEWGAKWSDGGYCPASPPRSEEFVRRHARSHGTRPIRRIVGSWIYDDTGEHVFASDGSELPQPEWVTLCGSMRFLPLILQAAAEETAAGRIVLAPFSVVAQADQGSEFKAMLDELHRRKIDAAARVIVVTDETGYYGASTSAEIEYARSTGKPVSMRAVASLVGER